MSNKFPNEGDVEAGKVVRIESYGAFVQLSNYTNKQSGRGLQGLVHISQLAPFRVENVQDVVSINDNVFVQVLEISFDDNQSRKIKLSMKNVSQQDGTPLQQHQKQHQNNNNNGTQQQSSSMSLSTTIESNLTSTIGMGIARDPMATERLILKQAKQQSFNGYSLVGDDEGEVSQPLPPPPHQQQQEKQPKYDENVASLQDTKSQYKTAPMGRGRGATLPAWMTQQQEQQQSHDGPTGLRDENMPPISDNHKYDSDSSFSYSSTSIQKKRDHRKDKKKQKHVKKRHKDRHDSTKRHGHRRRRRHYHRHSRNLDRETNNKHHSNSDSDDDDESHLDKKKRKRNKKREHPSSSGDDSNTSRGRRIRSKKSHRSYDRRHGTNNYDSDQCNKKYENKDDDGDMKPQRKRVRKDSPSQNDNYFNDPVERHEQKTKSKTRKELSPSPRSFSSDRNSNCMDRGPRMDVESDRKIMKKNKKYSRSDSRHYNKSHDEQQRHRHDNNNNSNNNNNDDDDENNNDNNNEKKHNNDDSHRRRRHSSRERSRRHYSRDRHHDREYPKSKKRQRDGEGPKDKRDCKRRLRSHSPTPTNSVVDGVSNDDNNDNNKSYNDKQESKKGVAHRNDRSSSRNNHDNDNNLSVGARSTTRPTKREGSRRNSGDLSHDKRERKRRLRSSTPSPKSQGDHYKKKQI